MGALTTLACGHISTTLTGLVPVIRHLGAFLKNHRKTRRVTVVDDAVW